MAVKPVRRHLATRAQVRWKTAGIAALIVACAAAVFPQYLNRGVEWVNVRANLGLPKLPEKPFNLGLDLQGGAHLIYQANLAQVPAAEQADAVEGVRDVIERRVRGGLGVSEPLVQTTKVGEAHRLIVDLPGVADVNTAIKMIGETPVLEFKEENQEPPRDLTSKERRELEQYNAAAEQRAKAAERALKGGKDFAAVVGEYSEDQGSKPKGGDLGFINRFRGPELYEWAAVAQDGAVSGVITLPNGWAIAKRVAGRAGPKEVSAAHLLVCYEGAERCTGKLSKAEAEAQAVKLKEQANPENFVSLVKTYSTEPGAGERGGDLGSFQKGTMVPEFEAAVWSAPTSTIIGPVETAFGWHLIYKKGESYPPEYQVSQVFIARRQPADIVPPPEPWRATGLSGKQLKRAAVTENQQTGEIQVSLDFNDEGSKLFGEITGRNVGKQVAIFLDGSPISTPRVNEAITSGSAVISGAFTLAEAKILAQRLNSGALPVPVELISQKTIGASLGADSLQRSFTAGVYALIAVMLFMLLYYRLPGALSVVSLGFYGLLSLALFKLFGVTLTLSGIAGFILSIGMAVDANILVFERLKEEMQLGRHLRSAMEESFTRAWPSIRDSHITALISCAFLIWFGTGFIQGFAVVLGMGTLINLFTAITVTRNIMRLVSYWLPERGNRLVLGYAKEAADQTV